MDNGRVVSRGAIKIAWPAWKCERHQESLFNERLRACQTATRRDGNQI